VRKRECREITRKKKPCAETANLAAEAKVGCKLKRERCGVEAVERLKQGENGGVGKERARETTKRQKISVNRINWLTHRGGKGSTSMA